MSNILLFGFNFHLFWHKVCSGVGREKEQLVTCFKASVKNNFTTHKSFISKFSSKIRLSEIPRLKYLWIILKTE